MSYKYKIGDKLECINTYPAFYAEPGVGWSIGLVFTVTDVYTTNEGFHLYYGGENGHGIYENWLKLVVTEWD